MKNVKSRDEFINESIFKKDIPFLLDHFDAHLRAIDSKLKIFKLRYSHIHFEDYNSSILKSLDILQELDKRGYDEKEMHNLVEELSAHIDLDELLKDKQYGNMIHYDETIEEFNELASKYGNKTI